MASKKIRAAPGAFPAKIGNKIKRQQLFAKHKKSREHVRRDERMRRRREEDKRPELRRERLQQNVPSTIDRKRVWDDVDSEAEDGLGVSIDVDRAKRHKSEKSTPEPEGVPTDAIRQDTTDLSIPESDNEDNDSMLDLEFNDEEEQVNEDMSPLVDSVAAKNSSTAQRRAQSPSQSVTSTNLSLMPEALATKFPTLFTQEPFPTPKILVTTNLNSTLHYEAQLLTTVFPKSVFIPRSAHRYGHKYSVREICKFASNRQYTAVVILTEDQKRPHGLDIVHLPQGPMFHFSLSNWLEGKKIPGHGRPTNHYPELILNNFRTPLGLLTAHLFRSLFPPRPEFKGRQVVTLHNQRDFIFVRRHRYVFRDKRETEKVLQGADGKPLKGAENIRAGLQELGPRFTMKLRRIDKGIQHSSGQEWTWKGKTDRVRTKFQL